MHFNIFSFAKTFNFPFYRLDLFFSNNTKAVLLDNLCKQYVTEYHEKVAYVIKYIRQKIYTSENVYN